ncbi:serine/threonine protein phosphatase [Mycobacterium asiaticum]|uniref:Serine/threonine protein phosphatase PstP n=1 Tax=Mycobacterium asiaticum TaxID=1790 RepID=A0A1A3NU15_MYCAS|nr:protein phosphatase 2C domain-containing protein [Mycobacterium asiaticum]OBK23807.1 serine/threonine protein phosphatase [Mycobacterium asiaticum]
MTLVLRYAARSDRGLVRANNEDSVYAGARLLALADGMGGHAAGEVASQLVIAALAHLDDDEPGGDLLAKLDNAVRSGNSAIAAQVEMEPELEGMGTTLTAILFAGNRLGLVHIGDSRGYLFRDGELTQITKDDTFVQTLVDEGRITAEEAHSHPQRSLIMRALTGHEVEPTLTMREARAGDRYLLCSDGLSDPVSNDTIAEALQIPDVAESAYRLIELALRGGGPDNVTVVVADVVDDEFGQTQPILAGAVSGDSDDDQLTLPNTAAGRASAIGPRKGEVTKRVAPQPEPPRRRWSRRRLGLVIGLIVLVLIAGLAIGRMVIRGNYYIADHNGTVAIMQGVQGSLLGVSLHSVHSVGCVNAKDEISDVSPGQQPKDCQLMKVDDLTPSGRASVQSRQLPAGSLDDARKQLRELAKSLRPRCQQRATSAPEPSAPSTNSRGTPESSAPPAPESSTPTSSSTTPTSAPSTTTTTSSTTSAAPATPASTTPSSASPPPGEVPQQQGDCRAAA